MLYIDDDGCDGISWWVYPNYPVNPGTGTLRFSSATTPATLKTFNGDFGCQIIERFTVGYALDVNEISEPNVNFQLFPNPSSDLVNMLLDMSTKQDVSYVITDVTGKQVYADKLMNISSDIYPINTTHLVSGLYFVTCKFDGGKQLTQKLIIHK